MRRHHLALVFAGLLMGAATAAAGAIVWLLVTAPATVASAVHSREVLPIVQMVAAALYEALLRLVGYIV